jgi:tetratricopeptide (TPR) repeat protein
MVTASALLACAILSGVAGTLWYARRAQAETAIAQRRFEALRKLSESLVFDLHDAIEKLPGATNARALVIRRALTYLNQLEAEAGGNKAVQRDLASAYMRIGDIQGSERGPHLGGADALSSAAECYTKALKLRRTLAAGDPNDEAAQRDLFASMWKVAEVYRRQGDLDHALQLSLDRLNRIRALRARRTSTDLDYSLAVSLTVIGDLYRVMGQYDLASRYARDALDVRQRILLRKPSDPRARRSAGLAYEFIAYPLTAQRKYAEATAAHKKALALFEPLASAAPLDTDLARLVQVAHANLCETLSRTGEIAEAKPHCHAAIEISERMLKADPVNIQAAEDFAASSWSMGVMLESAGRLADARRWERKSIALYENAVARDPDSVETVTGYADALIEAAGIEDRMRDPRACEHLSQATAVLARLRGISPKYAEVQVREEQARSLTLRFQYCSVP